MRYPFLAILLLTCGCPMSYWGGEMAGRAPGLHAKGGSFFSSPSVDVTSDCEAEIGELSYSRGTETQPSSFTLKDAKFGQSASAIYPGLTAALERLPDIQRSQTEYAAVWADAVKHVADVAGDFFTVAKLAGIKSTSGGLQMTLPGGFSIGGQKVNTPADFSKSMESIQQALQTLRDKAPLQTQPVP